MVQTSAGLLIFRRRSGHVEVLLVHPGGPFWARKDEAAWSIPKGLIDPGEDDLTAARREASEELGVSVDGSFDWLGEYRQPGGKRVRVWIVEPEPPIATDRIVSNTFRMEWPPKSGRFETFPEVDRAEWFSLHDAGVKILKGQRPMLDDLDAKLRAGRVKN